MDKFNKSIVFINCSCVGSTGRIIQDIGRYLQKKSYRTYLITPVNNGTIEGIHKNFYTSFPYEQAINRRIGNLFGNQFSFALISTNRIIRILKKIKPDIVHIHCINGNMVNIYRLINYLKRHSINTVITNHAEFFYTGTCDHSYECLRWKSGCGSCPVCVGIDKTQKNWIKMKNSFSGFERLWSVAVSPWVEKRMIQSPIMAKIKHQIILNGVDTNIFRPINEHIDKKITSENICKKTILHVTASFSSYNDKKGSKYLVELAKRFEGENVEFLVAGKVQGSFEVPSNVRLLGNISDQRELAKLYSLADVSIVLGKRETFSMPVAESLCSGTPVVGFFAGGPESIALDDFSEFCSFGDVNQLEFMLREKWLGFKTENELRIKNQARKKYSSEIMANSYFLLFEKILEKTKTK